jgi:cytochrome P450
MSRLIPKPDQRLSNQALRAMIQRRSVMAALTVFHAGLGDVFQLSLPAFNSVVLIGPEANRFVLVTAQDQLLWRTETDPVARLLGHGMLVEDGVVHDEARVLANPALHKRAIGGYIAKMTQHTDAQIHTWQDGDRLDMLVEMRKITLQIVMDTLFDVNFSPEMTRLWKPLLRLLRYISPGLWMLWPGMPQIGASHARERFDAYLYRIIRARRLQPEGDDLLGVWVRTPELSDRMIRDQVMTMIVAGHDTLAALLSWSCYMLAVNPHVQTRARAEVMARVGDGPVTMPDLIDMPYLGRVVDETLRLYPPAHLGNRRAAVDVSFGGHTFPAGSRLGYSIYLSHRHPAFWSSPLQFDPDRFETRHYPFAFVPFGGGARTCIGMNYALYEAKVVLARLLQQIELFPTPGYVREEMAVTLQPRMWGGGVLLTVRRRR